MDGKERAVIVIGCMDCRENDYMKALRESFERQGIKFIELRTGGAHVEPLKEDLKGLLKEYEIKEVRFLPHGSEKPEEVKGCGAVAVARKAVAGELPVSPIIWDNYIDLLKVKGVDFTKPSPDVEQKVAEVEYEEVRELVESHCKETGEIIAVPFELVRFKKLTQTDGKHSLLFRFPSARSVGSDINALGLDGREVYPVISSRGRNAAVSMEMAVKGLGIDTFYLLATNEVEERKMKAMEEKIRAQSAQEKLEGKPVSIPLETSIRVRFIGTRTMIRSPSF